MAEGSLEVKLPKIWTHGKAEVGRVREEGRRVAKHCVSQWLVAPEGRKVGSLKRRVWSHVAR